LAYRRVREWIPRAAVVLQIEPIVIKGYVEWWTAESEFLAQLKQLPNEPAMKELRESIFKLLAGQSLP
jgi:hypothetical protein